MLMSVLALLTAAAVPTEASVAPDPKQVTCIAPRDRDGRPEERKVCKTYAEWARYVRRAVALQQVRQRTERDIVDEGRFNTFNGPNPLTYLTDQHRMTTGTAAFGRSAP